MAEVPIELADDLSIPDLAALFMSATLVLANDCGPAHLAQMAGVPLVQPFDNSDGLNHESIPSWYDPRPGAICLTTRRKVPITTIPVEEVLRAAREVLQDPAILGPVRYVE